MKKMTITLVAIAALALASNYALADHCNQGRSYYRAPVPTYSRYAPPQVYSRYASPPHVHAYPYQVRPPHVHYYPGYAYPRTTIGAYGNNFSFRIGF